MPFAWARSAMRAPTLTAAVLLAALFASPRTPASREVACASVVPAASSMSCTEIQRSVLETARRGRPAVPFTFRRMRAWMRAFASTRPCAFSMVPASLLARGLAGLLLEDLAHEAESLQLVRVGWTNAADLGRRLADFLLVDTCDDDVRDVLGLRVRCDLDLDALRHRELHDVREADAEHDGPSLDLGLETDAHEVDLALETLGDAENRILEERAVQAVERLVLLLLAPHAALFRGVAREETRRGGHNGDAEAAENLGKLVLAGIEAPTRLARARDAVDDGIPGVVVLEVQAQQAASPVVHHLEVLDVALVLERASSTLKR